MIQASKIETDNNKILKGYLTITGMIWKESGPFRNKDQN